VRIYSYNFRTFCQDPKNIQAYEACRKNKEEKYAVTTKASEATALADTDETATENSAADEPDEETKKVTKADIRAAATALSKANKRAELKAIFTKFGGNKLSDMKVVAAMKAAGYDEALLYEKKLITLTQLERDLGKKKIAEVLGDLIVKPKGAPTLAPETDKRPAYH